MRIHIGSKVLALIGTGYTKATVCGAEDTIDASGRRRRFYRMVPAGQSALSGSVWADSRDIVRALS